MVSNDPEGGIVLPTFTERTLRIEKKADRKRNFDDNSSSPRRHFQGRRGVAVALSGTSSVYGRLVRLSADWVWMRLNSLKSFLIASGSMVEHCREVLLGDSRFKYRHRLP
jgi:hypothetical protein